MRRGSGEVVTAAAAGLPRSRKKQEHPLHRPTAAAFRPPLRAAAITLARRQPRTGSTTMPLVSMRQLLDEAARGGYGVGAFNVNNMEQIQAIMEAARETQSPVIIQASRGARAYSQDRFLYHLMIAA